MFPTFLGLPGEVLHCVENVATLQGYSDMEVTGSPGRLMRHCRESCKGPGDLGPACVESLGVLRIVLSL